MNDSENRAAPAAAAETASPEPRRKRRRRGGLECKLGLLIGIGGLIGTRLGQLWIAFDVFAQFTLQFAIVTLAFLVALVLPRGRLTVAFLLIIAGLLAIGVWPHVASRSPQVIGAAKPGEQVITVASFNTWYDNAQSEAIAAEVERLDADIMTLIEVGPGNRAILEHLRAKYPYQADCFRIDFCDLAILSKFPVTEHSGKEDWDGPSMIMAKLGPEAGGLTVIGVHTIRFPHSRAQLHQVQALGRLIETISGPKLMMGDFNATPFSRITSTISDHTGMLRLTQLPSWPSRIDLPQVAIDHIFVSPGIHPVEDERIGNPAGSDHYPVTMKLALPAR